MKSNLIETYFRGHNGSPTENDLLAVVENCCYAPAEKCLSVFLDHTGLTRDDIVEGILPFLRKHPEIKKLHISCSEIIDPTNEAMEALALYFLVESSLKTFIFDVGITPKMLTPLIQGIASGQPISLVNVLNLITDEDFNAKKMKEDLKQNAGLQRGEIKISWTRMRHSKIPFEKAQRVSGGSSYSLGMGMLELKPNFPTLVNLAAEVVKKKVLLAEGFSFFQALQSVPENTEQKHPCLIQ